MPNLDPSDPTLNPPWTLEVVRGVTAGRVYPLDGGEVILGNGEEGAEGKAFLNLADQEGASPRKMARRHVALTRSSSPAWTLRDLDSPGGTFVNNRRVLGGVTHPLAEGDVIQVGSVQLRFARADAAPTSARPASSGFSYRSPSGITCRSWDDFLTFSAQRWEELRDELTSGRLGDFLKSIGQAEWIPPRIGTKPSTDQADEAVDAWLARLPTRISSKPQLDVYPLRMSIDAPGGGVSIRRKVRVANVGHGLLRARFEVEATGSNLTLDPEWVDREIVIRDFIDVPFDVAIPDPILGPSTAVLVIHGADTEKRVVIAVDRRAKVAQASTLGGLTGEESLPIPGPIAGFRAIPAGRRLVIGALIAMATRLVVGVVGGAIGEDAMVASGPEIPRLGAGVVAFAVVGSFLGGWLATRRGGRRDAVSGAVAGAGLGVLLVTVLVAGCRAIEPTLGSMATSPLAVCGFWAILGGAVAGSVGFRHPRVGEPAKGLEP